MFFYARDHVFTHRFYEKTVMYDMQFFHKHSCLPEVIEKLKHKNQGMHLLCLGPFSLFCGENKKVHVQHLGFVPQV